MTAELKELVHHAIEARRIFALSELIGDLSQHINQPLGAIAAYAEATAEHVRAGTADAAILFEVSEQISAQVLRASEVVRRVRERIRVAGERVQSVDASALAADVLRSLQPAFQRLAVPVRLDDGAPTPPVACYAPGLTRCVSMLALRCMETAANHADHERVLRVRVVSSAQPPAVEIGIGIGGYDPFASSGDVVPESVPYDAPCLAAEIVAVRSLIESHGGRLWVVAESRGLCSARLLLPAEQP